MRESIPIKIVYNTEIRRVPICTSLEFEDLKTYVKQLFPSLVKFLFKYVDEEGDKVTVTNNSELSEALRIAQDSKSIFRLLVIPTEVPPEIKEKIVEIIETIPIQELEADSANEKIQSQLPTPLINALPDFVQDQIGQIVEVEKKKRITEICKEVSLNIFNECNAISEETTKNSIPLAQSISATCKALAEEIAAETKRITKETSETNIAIPQSLLIESLVISRLIADETKKLSKEIAKLSLESSQKTVTDTKSSTSNSCESISPEKQSISDICADLAKTTSKECKEAHLKTISSLKDL